METMENDFEYFMITRKKKGRSRKFINFEVFFLKSNVVTKAWVKKRRERVS